MEERGFTLIELLVTLGIVGVLSSIALPLFSEYKEKAYVAHVQAAVLNLVKSAELYAIDNPRIEAIVDVDDDTFNCFSAPGADSCSTKLVNTGYVRPNKSGRVVCALFLYYHSVDLQFTNYEIGCSSEFIHRKAFYYHSRPGFYESNRIIQLDEACEGMGCDLDDVSSLIGGTLSDVPASVLFH